MPFLKKNAPGPFKVTLPSPANFMVSSYKRGVSERFYPSHADLLRTSWKLCATKSSCC